MRHAGAGQHADQEYGDRQHVCHAPLRYPLEITTICESNSFYKSALLSHKSFLNVNYIIMFSK